MEETMLRTIAIASVFLFACGGVGHDSLDQSITGSGSGSDGGTGSGSGSGSGSDCPTCSASGSGCCDPNEPIQQAPTTAQSTTMFDELGDSDLLDDDFTTYSDTTNGCTQNLPQLPEGCIVYRGNARWLYCWMNGYTTPVGCLTAGGVNASCEMTDDQITAAANACNMQMTSQDRIQCAIDQVRGVLGGWGNNGNVCRHFGRCFKKVWEAMGRSQSVTSRWFGVISPKGHTFNLIDTAGGGRYYCDASNNILFWCP
jgi:hypothetical protein